MTESWTKRSAKAVNRLTQKAGIAINRSPLRTSLIYNLHTIIERYEIDCVVDVGAHRGEFARSLRTQLGFGGRIVSYEPASEAFSELSALMSSDPGWSGHRIALGSEPGQAELSVLGKRPGRTDFSSLHAPNSLAEAELGVRDPTDVEMVEVRRLDGIWEQLTHGLSRKRVLLKIDTQGHDMHVIRGLGRHLGEVPALLLEIALLPIYDGIPTIETVLPDLAEAGFAPSGFFAVSRTRDLRLIEVDGTFVNMRFAT